MAIWDNLSHLWTLNNTPNGTVGGLNLTPVNTPTYVTGHVYDQAASLSSNKHYSLADSAAISAGAGVSFTFGVWVKPASLATTMGIVTKDDIGTANREYNLIYDSGVNRFRMETWKASGGGGGDYVPVTSSVVPSAGTWYYIVAKFDDDNNLMTIKVNDVADTASQTVVYDGAATFIVGGQLLTGSIFNAFNGVIGPIYRWSRATTDNEDTRMYNAGAGQQYFTIASVDTTDFSDAGLLVSCHFGVVSNVSVALDELGSASDSPSLFNPTELDWDDWLDKAQWIGAQGVMLTAKYWEGHCLWPSTTSNRSILHPECTWYGTYENRNPLLEFVTKARERGLMVGLYVNVRDYYYDTDPDEASGMDYTAWTIALLTELLSGDYGLIEFLFLDGWGSGWVEVEPEGGIGFDMPEYYDVMQAIRDLSPTTVVLVNNHETAAPLHGDARLWERSAGEDTPEPDDGHSLFPALALHDTLHYASGPGGAPSWFRRYDAHVDTTAEAGAAIGRRWRTRRKACSNDARYVYFANFSPDYTGRVTSDTIDMLEHLRMTRGGNLILDASFASASPPANLQTISGWSLSVNNGNFVINPTGEVWANNAAAASEYYRSDISMLNGRVELDFKFASVPTNCDVWVAMRSTSNGANEDRMHFQKISTDATLYLAVIPGFAVEQQLTWDNTIAFATNTRYRLVIEKHGSTMYGEFWTEISGEMVLWGKGFGSDTTNAVAGYPAFGIVSSGSSSTGVHVTGFRVYQDGTYKNTLSNWD